MSPNSLYRWQGTAILLNAALLVAAGILVAVIPEGGLANPVAPLLYYAALVSAVFASLCLYTLQIARAGRLGFTGFVLAAAGAVVYSAPAYALVAGTSGVATWHDLWFFAMSSALPLGATLYFVGSLLLGITTLRAGIFPRWSGWALVAGFAIWLVAFYLSVVPGLLTLGSVIAGVGMAGVALQVLVRRAAAPQVQPAG
jgi:hypothetical protein